MQADDDLPRKPTVESSAKRREFRRYDGHKLTAQLYIGGLRGNEGMTNPKQARWRDFLNRHSVVDGVLPLMHTTRAFSLDEIIKGHELTPRFCDVFDWPIAFVLEPATVQEIKRVFPFDTGAFTLSIHSEFFDYSSQMDDFPAGNSLEDARLIAGSFYRSNQEYYTGSTRHNVELRLREFEAKGVHELARMPGNANIDSNGRRDERSRQLNFRLKEQYSLSMELSG